jgi:hypothetical protein
MAWVQLQVNSRGICGRQSGYGAGFLQVPQFPCQFLQNQMFHFSHLSRGLTEWVTYSLSTEGLSLTLTYRLFQHKIIPVKAWWVQSCHVLCSWIWQTLDLCVFNKNIIFVFKHNNQLHCDSVPSRVTSLAQQKSFMLEIYNLCHPKHHNYNLIKGV